jgi:hypothetical protein
MQFRSSCLPATIIVLLGLCVRRVTVRKYLNPVQNYIHRAFCDVRSRNIPTLRSCYVSVIYHIWHLSCLLCVSSHTLVVCTQLLQNISRFLSFCSYPCLLFCLCSVCIASWYYPKCCILIVCLSLSRLNQIIFTPVRCCCLLVLLFPLVNSSIYTQFLPVLLSYSW